VGGAEFGEALGKGGGGVTVFWYGQASLEPASIDFFRTIPQTPFTVKHFPHWVSQTTDGEDLATLVRLVAEGRLHPEVGVVAGWEETGAVLEELYGRRVNGNAVLKVR
jgi:NADPH:quinone reductase-like Zn-dependent oxidoreductase